MRPHGLEDEEVVLGDQGVVVEAAFEVRMASRRSAARRSSQPSQPQSEVLKLVDLGAGSVADPHDDISEPHSRLRRIISKLWLALEMTQPTSKGVNSTTVRQPIVMMFVGASCDDETVRRRNGTIGPGSR